MFTRTVGGGTDAERAVIKRVMCVCVVVVVGNSMYVYSISGG